MKISRYVYAVRDPATKSVDSNWKIVGVERWRFHTTNGSRLPPLPIWFTFGKLKRANWYENLNRGLASSSVFPFDAPGISDIAFLKDGNTLGIITGGQAFVWNIASGKLERSFPSKRRDHAQSGFGINVPAAFSPEGTHPARSQCTFCS